MKTTRKIEIFSAGCPVCEETVEMVKRSSCPSCEVTVLDTREKSVSEKAKSLGIRSIPAIVIDGRPAGCCSGKGPDIAILKNLGLGQSLP